MISFTVTTQESAIITEIVDRATRLARKAGIDYDRTTALMDITAIHANEYRLRLFDLWDADDFNFAHDVFGIKQHINRETGKLEDSFVPRFAYRRLPKQDTE